MSLTLKNRVFETTVTTGTGSYLLAGVVNASCRPFADAGNGGLIPYLVEQGTKSEWGIGTYDSGTNTLARTTILGNYLGTTAAISWSAGTKNIYSPDLTELFNWINFNNTFGVSALKVAESAAPSTPASGFLSIYAKTDGVLYAKDDAGTESALSSAGMQPLDATLTAFAALTIAANSITIGSGADAFLQTTFAANTFPARASTGNIVAKTITDFGLSLVDDADAATARATLGLVIGTNVQAYDAELAALAGLTSAADKWPYFTGSGAAALADVSPFSRTLLDDTTAAAWRTTLGVGTGSGDALTTNPLSQFAATTSAQLAGVITNETGSGQLVFATSPTLVTPSLGVASATTINKVTLTAPATSATLTIADGKTLTASNTLTLTGTDSSSIAFGTGGTVAYRANDLSVFASTTSAQLDSVITDGTGSGLLVFNTSPTLESPVLRAASATSLTLSTPLAFADGGTGLTALGTALQVLRTNAGETAMEWATAGVGDALVANNLDQFADVTQTSGKTLDITENTTLNGGTHSGTNTGDQSRASLGIDTTDAVTFGDLTVSNLVVNGTTTTVNSTTLTVDDPLIVLGDGNLSDSVDLGFVGIYTSGGTKYVGLFRDASDAKFKLFTGLEEEPTSTVNIAGTGYTVATLVADIEGNLTGDIVGNADTATALETARSIYGNSFDGSADLDQIIASTYGGTGNGFTAFTGPTTAEKTFTLPDASATILTTNDAVTIAQGGTGAANAADARDNLGLEIGVDVQAYDATLTAFAALTIAANSLTIGTGDDAFSQTTFAANTFPARDSTGDLVAKPITDFALTILDDADAAAVRTTIGAGTGSGDALVTDSLDQFADVTQTAGKTLAITDDTTLNGGTHSGTNTGDQTSVSGNAGTATALETARNINGVAFDGTADITVTAAGSTLSDTVTVANGGTGLTALGTALQVLRTNAGETAMEWADAAGISVAQVMARISLRV